MGGFEIEEQTKIFPDALAFFHAVPAIVFGVSGLLLSLFVLRRFVPLYGTLTLLVGVHIIQRLSFGTRVTNSAIIAVSEELEEAAEVCGASRRNVILRILLPLISATLIDAFFWIGLLTLRELTLATILFSPNNITLSVVIWSLWSSGQHGPSAALSLVMILLMMPVMFSYWRVGNRVADVHGLWGVRAALTIIALRYGIDLHQTRIARRLRRSSPPHSRRAYML